MSPDDFRELFRVRKHDEVRIYKLRIVPHGAELWRTTFKGGDPETSIKEDDLAHLDAAVQTLRELEERLMAGGWRTPEAC